ncbi:hypothetical protein [Streptomyces sp. NPDC056010]|uniref:hypothetical protein n=1 Tax=Streptomyces sp. NPDC056010 TaxID=3345679 RepID=UPI0035D894FE
MIPEAVWLTLHQEMRLATVASVLADIVRLLAQDPGAAIQNQEPARMWALLDHAIA